MQAEATHHPHRGAARSIGRIGALAVALGVGAALATGHGAGVARADDGSDSSASGASSESSPADSPTADSTAPAADASESAASGEADSSSGPGVPEMNVSSSGGAHTSESGTSTTESEPEAQPEPDDEPTEPTVRQGNSRSTPRQATMSRPAAVPDDTPVTTAREHEPAQSPTMEPVAVQLDSPTMTAVEHVEAADVEAPEPQQPSTAETILAAAVAPFLLPGPGAPAASPMLWAVLAWTRREADQSELAESSDNTAPVADIQNVDMDENTSHSGTLPAATDADGDPVAYTVASSPTYGTVVIDPGGDYTYTPDAGYFGRDSFAFSVTDPLGGRADYTVFVTVRMVNNAPVASDAAITVTENGSHTGALPAATDADGEAVTYSLAAGPSRGTVTVDADGAFTYTPEPGASGPDRFLYDVTDGVTTSTYTVTVRIDPINHAPVAVDGIVTTQHGVPVTFAIFNDPDGDPLTFTLDQPSSSGSFTAGTDGTVTFTPRAGFAGEATFAYTVTDPSGSAASATVTVVVKNGPVVTRDDVYIGDDTVYSGNVLANDIDSDRDPISVVDYTVPSRGTLVLAPDGTFTYTPEPGVSGTFEFSYTVSDGVDFATASVRFIVAAVGKPPVSAPDSATVEAGETVVIEVLANDTDPNGTGLYVISVDEPAHGSVYVTDSGLEYTAGPDFTGVVTFAYTVSNGWEDRTETVTVTVNPSTAPVTVDDEITVRAGDEIVIDALTNDRIPKGAEIVVTSQPDNGTVRFDEQTGTFVYTPGEESRGDGFEYTVTDALGRTSSAWVTITVDEAPYAEGDYAATPIGEAVVIDVLENDYDSEEGRLEVRVVSQPEHGGTASAQKDGTIRFTPSEGFQGYVEFGYSITDRAGNVATATVGVNVYDPTPVELDKKYTVGKDRTITVSAALGLLSGTQYAEYGKARLYVKPRNGTVKINLDGSFTYTPNQGFVGEDSFEFALDGGEFGDGATAYIAVTPDGPGADAGYGDALAPQSSGSAYGTCGDSWYPGLSPANQWPTCLFVADTRPEDLV